MKEDSIDAAIAAAVAVAVDETVILLHPPSTFSRCINSDGVRGCQQNDSLVNG